MPLHPFTQHRVDARLPPRACSSEMPQYLRRQTDVSMHLRIGLLWSAAGAGKRTLCWTHYLATNRDFGAIELLIGPLRRIVGVNPRTLKR